MKTLPMPASSAAFSSARCSTCVTSETMLITAWIEMFEPPRLRLFDEMGEHLFRPLKIADDAADQRRLHDDIAALAAGHVGGLLAEGDDLLGHLVDRDERRLVQHDTAALDGDDRACRAEVDRHRIGDQFF